MTGESPVIDTSATRVVQTFKLEQLQSIPNARDMWSLLAVTPAVQMTRIDVGGNRAGTQTGYRVRLRWPGPCVDRRDQHTEGTGGAGFYFDYSSLEEVFLGTSGQSAEMPNPGVQSQFIAKSGGNQFNGEYYIDCATTRCRARTSRTNTRRPARSTTADSRPQQRDRSLLGHGHQHRRPDQARQVWWFGTYRKQFNAIGQPNFQFDKTFDTTLWNAIGKGTYQATQNHKFIGYYQWGQKIQPNRLARLHRLCVEQLCE